MYGVYLELPVCMPGLPPSDDNHLGNPDKVVAGKFLPASISAYHQSYFEDRVMIYLSCGQPFLIELTIEAYESKIKSYWELVSRKQNIKIGI